MAQNKYFVIPPVPPIHRTTTHNNKEKRRINFLVIFLVIFISFKTLGQNLDDLPIIPPFDSLINTLGQYHKANAIYQVEQFAYIEKWKWLKYTPSFGWNFMSNTPFIGYNTSTLFEAINNKRQKKAVLESIIHKVNLEYQTAAISLKLKYDIFSTKTEIYKQRIRVLDLSKAYIKIQEDLYKKREITPTEIIQERLGFEGKLLDLITAKYELQLLKNEILELAFYGSKKTLISRIEDVTTN